MAIAGHPLYESVENAVWPRRENHGGHGDESEVILDPGGLVFLTVVVWLSLLGQEDQGKMSDVE